MSTRGLTHPLAGTFVHFVPFVVAVELSIYIYSGSEDSILTIPRYPNLEKTRKKNRLLARFSPVLDDTGRKTDAKKGAKRT